MEIWDKCYFGESQRHEFTPAFDGMYAKIVFKYRNTYNNKKLL
jgi:hypothetical protein